MRDGPYLLDFPHPYRAMLALSNDIDGTSWDDFLAVHRQFEGMGLPFADSIFVYQIPGAREWGLSLAEYPSFSDTPHTETLLTMTTRGRIDTLHGLGNHSGVGGVDRKTAERAARFLLERGLSFPVWTNHGDSKNLHNVRIGSGDDPTSPAYVADLLTPIGVRFLWIGDLVPFVGQGRRLLLTDTYLNRLLHPSLFMRTIGLFRYLAKWAVTRNDPLDHSINDLIYPVTLADGRRFWAFRRFGRWDSAQREDLTEILSEGNLKRLCRRGGYMIVYIHLGKTGGRGGSSFSGEEGRALERLARYFRERKILVTTTGRLLAYHLVRRGLAFSVTRSRNRYMINILGIRDELTGDRIADSHDLRGITFSVPREAEAVLSISNRPIRNAVIEEGPHLSRYIGVPWEALGG